MATSGGSSPYTTPRHSPSDGNSQRAASLTAASASASNARATPANTPAIHDSPNSTTHTAPAAMAGMRVPRRSAVVSSTTACAARNATARSGSGGVWPVRMATAPISRKPEAAA